MKLQIAPGVLALLPQARTIDGLALIADATRPA
jgi:hypothetical protein